MEIIWINDQPLIICNFQDEVPEYITRHYKNHEFGVGVPADIKLLIRKLDNKTLDACIIETENVNASFKFITAPYHRLEAGGGLITDPEGNILLIFRRGKWDLPKGKLDEGETIEECVLREVKEETGLNSISLQEKIGTTYHIYTIKERDEKVLKHTYWYKINFTGKELPVPQIEEDIVDVQWIQPQHLAKYLHFSYGNIRYLFHLAGYTIE